MIQKKAVEFAAVCGKEQPGIVPIILKKLLPISNLEMSGGLILVGIFC